MQRTVVATGAGGAMALALASVRPWCSMGKDRVLGWSWMLFWVLIFF